ncbi:antitoxin Phd_YefM of type II toxin-antitoxin system [Humitalea rosea]|uniref:Antitoxin n=1 Tax=Humitalea rosea TaxID=990373 RepID=A0A2W7JFY2_9PROT|nr:type II toxin-antitoxin system Phd/YefM family antitoxin [Humitalea rosea]PZW50973.1 antitoxin Phd_YefM of type II toxin-antitoxin system [Humitalea rosea]
MIRVSSAEFQRHLATYHDAALTQGVAILHHGRERTVLISAEEYHRLKRRDRQVLELGDFTQADVAAVEATRAPEATKAFDDEIAS